MWKAIHNLFCDSEICLKLLINLNECTLVNPYTVEPCYNMDLGTMKFTFRFLIILELKESWDQQNNLVIRGFCEIQPLYNEVLLYSALPILKHKG